MPSIYFGRTVNKKRANNAAVDTPRGWLEPVEPSQFKIYAMPTMFSPIWSIITPILGHLVAVLSYPQFSFLPLQSFGELFQAPSSNVGFSKVGFGFHLEKGEKMSEIHITELEKREFRSITYANNNVWLKDRATRDDFVYVSEIPKTVGNGRTPDRFLTINGFRAYLQLAGLTTRICETFHYLSTGGAEAIVTATRISNSAIKEWKNISDYATSPDIPIVDKELQTATFVKNNAFLVGPVEDAIGSVVRIVGSTSGVTYECSAAALNPLAEPMKGFTKVYSKTKIVRSGKIFKFHPELALPDVNLIGDVIGRRFITCLGSSREEQYTNLQDIKSGLSGLRLTTLGDEWAHFYKCLDIAITAQCGLMPFFTNKTYEGCVLMGGAGATFSLNGEIVGFESRQDLADEFVTASTHSTSLERIADKFPKGVREDVLGVESMVRLRELCLELECTADDRDYIQQQGAHLDFGFKTWPISPAKLSDCFSLISDLTQLTNETPISRLCLFSKDAVLIGLSCFGEKSSPSWDIPQGQFVSIKTASPPSAPQVIQKKPPSGIISDATWTMTVRQTDLLSANDEFRRMAKAEGYRSISSNLARRQGMKTFSKDQMSRFWKDMQEAYRHVNPDMQFVESEVNSKKRAADVGEGPMGGSSLKRRALGF